MGKLSWKWILSFFWESLPSTLQDKIRSWAWDAVIGTIVMLAYFIWRAVMTVGNQSPEVVVLVGLGFFVCGLYLAHFVRTRFVGKKSEAALNIYERNTYNWDYSGDPNIPTLITSDTVLRKPVNTANGEALLTPLIGNESHDVIAQGATFIVGINYTQGTIVSFGPHSIWRAMNNVPINGQRFIASLDEPVLHGRLKVGPDEMIRAKLPIGKYQVAFSVQGRSEKGQTFIVERSCHIEIYGAREDRVGVATRGQITSPLKIEFDGADVRKKQEPHPTFPSDQVTRRFYGVRVRNDGSENTNNVSLEVEKIEQIPDRADEIVPIPAPLGLKFLFKLTDKPIQDFSPQMSDRVPLISHVKSILLSHIFKMASTQRYEFPHNNRRHRIHVKVTGSGVPPVSRTFIVWADGDGDMKMTGE